MLHECSPPCLAVAARRRQPLWHPHTRAALHLSEQLRLRPGQPATTGQRRQAARAKRRQSRNICRAATAKPACGCGRPSFSPGSRWIRSRLNFDGPGLKPTRAIAQRMVEMRCFGVKGRAFLKARLSDRLAASTSARPGSSRMVFCPLLRARANSASVIALAFMPGQQQGTA